MLKIQRQKQLRKEISLIPLINIIFLLLIFFMVAGQVQRMETLEVLPPKAESGKERRYLPVVMYLAENGAIALNGDVIEKEDLKLLLETVLINHDGEVASVTLRADKRASASDMVWLMNKIKAVGGVEVSIVTKSGGAS